MNNWMAQKLLPHVGHDISCVTYGDSEDPDDVCIECDECGTVLVSAEDFEADMAGDYKITHQLRIGGRTLVLGHNPEDHETPFLVCYQDYGLGFPRFTEAVGGDDYLEIVELFSLRLQQQIEAVKQQRAERTALAKEGITSRAEISELEQSANYYRQKYFDSANALERMKTKYDELKEKCRPFLQALEHFPEVAKLFTEKVKQLFSFKEAQERAEKEAREKERQERIKARRNKRGMER